MDIGLDAVLTFKFTREIPRVALGEILVAAYELSEFRTVTFS